MNDNLLDKSFRHINYYIGIRDKSLYNKHTISYIESILKSGTNCLLKNKKQHHEYFFHIMLEDELPEFIIKSKNKIDPFFVYSTFQNQFIHFNSLSNIIKLMVDTEIIVAHIKLRYLLH